MKNRPPDGPRLSTLHSGIGRGPFGPLLALLLVALLLAVACAPVVEPMGPPTQEARLEADAAVLADGARLPLRRWAAQGGAPHAVILALHGFNDYSNAFELPALYWAERGITTYAYDQRGFGDTASKGLWAGAETLAADAGTIARLIRARHPGVPFFLLGESMGGAVLIAAANPALPPADGVILVAPAVRGRDTMNVVYRTTLWLGAHLFPWAALSAEGLDIVATDNLAVLQAMQNDPLIIKRTRVDAIWGLVDLMDKAQENAPKLNRTPTLVVYGTRDEVVPPEPVGTFVARLPRTVPVAVYEGGYHMLLRDLGAKPVLDDVLAWIAHPGAPLASPADEAGAAYFNRVDSAPKTELSSR
ncbi:MAG: lysophospholipase [Alphaproteobacteria bacterium]